MPVTKQAKKKLRKDRKREKANLKLVKGIKKVIKKTRTSPTLKQLTQASKTIDKAAKNNIIHKNKAARLKSRLSRLSSSPKTKKS